MSLPRVRIIPYAIRSASIAALLALPISAPMASDTSVSIELNKLEPAGENCRAYLVIRNGTETAFRNLQLDLVMFDTSGIVAKRLAVEAAPLAPMKTVLKVFSITKTGCGDLSRVLLNDVVACTDASGKINDCVALTAVSSKAKAEFIK